MNSVFNSYVSAIGGRNTYLTPDFVLSHGRAYLVFGQLDLDDLGVTVDGHHLVQHLVGAVQPRQQLVDGVLELTQIQQRVLQLVL